MAKLHRPVEMDKLFSSVIRFIVGILLFVCDEYGVCLGDEYWWLVVSFVAHE